VAQPAPNRTGLGPAGNLASPYAPPPALAGLAVAVVASQARASGDAGSALESARSLQSALDDKLGAATGVSVDQEMTLMVQLQSAYAANARVISAVQTMLDQTLSMLK